MLDFQEIQNADVSSLKSSCTLSKNEIHDKNKQHVLTLIQIEFALDVFYVKFSSVFFSLKLTFYK